MEVQDASQAVAGQARARLRIDPYRLRERMVDNLRRCGIRDEAVLAAMRRVPRHLFVDEVLAMRAYELATLPIGFGQTISNPRTVATMSELLQVQPGMRVLEIGTGSGYQTAVLAALGCRVWSIERLLTLYEQTLTLLGSLEVPELDLSQVHCALGDGTLGYPAEAPYARIIVTAGGPAVPAPLVQQLDEDGIMVIPVGDSGKQRLKRLFRRKGDLYEQDCGPASFVDLVGDHGW